MSISRLDRAVLALAEAQAHLRLDVEAGEHLANLGRDVRLAQEATDLLRHGLHDAALDVAEAADDVRGDVLGEERFADLAAGLDAAPDQLRQNAIDGAALVTRAALVRVLVLVLVAVEWIVAEVVGRRRLLGRSRGHGRDIVKKLDCSCQSGPLV